MHRPAVMERPVDADEVRLWFPMLGRGVAAAIFGMLLVSGDQPSFRETAIGFLVYLLVDGALSLYAAKRARASHGRPGLLISVAVVDVVIGVVAVIVPTAAALRFVAGARAIVTGVCDARWSRRHDTSDMLTLAGVAAVALGVVLLVAWPGPGDLALSWLLGLQVMVSGALFTGGALSELRRAVTLAPQPA